MDLLTELTIFVLAVFVGFEVISKVPNTLHTPLMSGTNAIHGIVLLGGLLVLGLQDNGTLNKIILVIAFALFIYGLGGLTGPRTAVRGNRIAAVGMAIAVLATFLYPDFGEWGLIILG